MSNHSRCATLRTASRAQLEHGGQKTVEYENGDGGSMNVIFEVADVTRPLVAVGQLQKRGMTVVANEHGRTIARVAGAESAHTHNAQCRGRIEGILLQQSRMKPKEEEPRGGRTTTKSVPMESEKPAGPATQYGGSSGSGVPRNDATGTGAMQAANEKPPEAPHVEMGAEDPCAAQVKRAKTIMGLGICVLEAQDDVYDEAPGERRRTRLRTLATTRDRRRRRGARSDKGAGSTENARQSLQSPECRSAKTEETCIWHERCTQTLVEHS